MVDGFAGSDWTAAVAVLEGRGLVGARATVDRCGRIGAVRRVPFKGMTTQREPDPYIIAAGISRTVRLTTLAVPTAARPTADIDWTAADDTAEAALTATQPPSARHEIAANAAENFEFSFASGSPRLLAYHGRVQRLCRHADRATDG